MTFLRLVIVVCLAALGARAQNIRWVDLSSKKGDLPSPGTSTQQTGALVVKVDRAGLTDFVLSFRRAAPALVWYRRGVNGWTRYVLEKELLPVEAGGAAHDIDGDGDLDIVFGGDAQGDQLWWWENPYPAFDPNVAWKRRTIKSGGARQHHDQIFADVKGTGRAQLIFWNQRAKTLFLAEIPKDPRNAESWPLEAIYSGQAGEGVDSAAAYAEGVDAFDVDGDGRLDILAGNYWFQYLGNGKFKPVRIGTIGGRIKAGRFNQDSRYAQVVIAPGDGSGPLRFYEAIGDPANPDSWRGRNLLERDMVHGHTLHAGDIDGDGRLDIFAAEMAKWTNTPVVRDHPGATAWILYGDGKGNFTTSVLKTGDGWHEGKLGDFDGDGDLDILNKPYTWDAPRVDLWLNNSSGPRPATRVSIEGSQWRINGRPTYPGTSAEGLLMNVRTVNAVFEDRNRSDFNPEANTSAFIARIPDYVAHGIRAFTLSLQGGAPGYEGALNSAFDPDGSLLRPYLDRVRRVIEASDRTGAVVILSLFYQRQDQVLRDERAVRAGVVNAARWLRELGRGNVVLEIANEFGHKGFDHSILRSAAGQGELIRLARAAAPRLPVSTSGMGGGAFPEEVARAADFLLIHFNNTRLDDIPARIRVLKRFGKPIVCNEDDKPPAENLLAAELSAAAGASWGLMLPDLNQRFPFEFRGAADAPELYAGIRRLTGNSAWNYFPPPESQGGWRKVDQAADIHAIAGMDPGRLASLREWLLASDRRNFAAVVIRRGRVVLEVERNNSSVTATSNIKSCAKAICATVAGIAAERSRRGDTPRKMTFDDAAFDFLPWAEPLSDPRKRKITVRQLLNHTSGVAPESTGARNQGPWEYAMGHSGDPRTAQLAFEPGTDLGYSTHAFYHASLVIEQVTGMPYERFAVESLLQPIGVEKWWFEFFDGGEKYGRHASHALGLPARDMARIAYCMLRGGRWNGRQVIPAWFVTETGEPTHAVKGIKSFERDAESWSHGWELPARLSGGRGAGIPKDARFKPGSGGQLMAFVPSLDLVVVRQTGGSGAWEYEEYLRRACDAVVAP